MAEIEGFLKLIEGVSPGAGVVLIFGALFAYYLKNEAKAPPPAGPSCHADPGVMEVLRRMENMLIEIKTIVERRR